jgi:hypothetical protein
MEAAGLDQNQLDPHRQAGPRVSFQDTALSVTIAHLVVMSQCPSILCQRPDPKHPQVLAGPYHLPAWWPWGLGHKAFAPTTRGHLRGDFASLVPSPHPLRLF